MKLLKILYVKALILLLPFRKINRKTTDERFRESIMHSGGHYETYRTYRRRYRRSRNTEYCYDSSIERTGITISYIGSYNGIEKKLIEEMGIPYYGISSGKLRRYFDVKNFTDPFRVLKGFSEARKLLKKLKPDVVFSKGGFVSVPVVIAAKRCKIPAIIHESDMTPGLANKLCIPSAVKVCCNFPETVSKLPADKAVLTGTPIRQELLQGDPEAALRFTGLKAVNRF